jgi:hypothetical protein
MGKKVRNYNVRLSRWFTLILLSLFIKLNIFYFADIFCIFDKIASNFMKRIKKLSELRFIGIAVPLFLIIVMTLCMCRRSGSI